MRATKMKNPTVTQIEFMVSQGYEVVEIYGNEEIRLERK